MVLDDPTRPPFEYNTTPRDVVSGLISDSIQIDDKIHISVEELLKTVIVGIKVRKESVTDEVLNLLNLRVAERMGLKGIDPSELINAERRRRELQQQTNWPVVIESNGKGGLQVRRRGN